MFQGTVSKYDFRFPESKPIRRAKREACERVRMENAAKRNKTLPRAVRRAMMAAAAEAKAKEVPTDAEISVVDELRRLDERTPGEGGGVTDNAGTETEQVEVSPLPIRSKSASKSKHHHEVDPKKERQAKSCTGLWDMIDEGISLASDDGDVARIHAANRKAWPRGQTPIAAHATAEDREIAELVCRGLISHEDLQVDHDNFEGDVCLYTVRVVEAPKKGRKGNNLRRQAVQIGEPVQWEAESDWWYLDDEAYARLLSDGGTDLVDWSETSSFVYMS
ncbi:hypothetical protein C8A05DRAFT_20314 [Staphylotrichum tortipilum]|uniref:Uncharacterized protein n=1 Tax=Staphylotrichum tortipilum TaxID=2831512 RepID=A0AAN6MB71_9PEZI|nr:hypothetical protein C8A05DRAFT_20314 [Staphylotrichum longicolle]